MKICTKCKSAKRISEFGRDSQKIDGLSSSCKICVRKRNELYRKVHPEKFKESARRFREENRESLRKSSRKRFLENREKCLEASRRSYYKNKLKISKTRKLSRLVPERLKKDSERQKIWRSENLEAFRRSVRKWQINNREKVNAHAAVHRAVSSGVIKRPEQCSFCENKCKPEGHHEDYSKPLDVVWLCRLCHAEKIETVKV
jgi:hypothetical protein